MFDIHDVLDITVFDEDKRGAPEFLGRVVIPLLQVTIATLILGSFVSVCSEMRKNTALFRRQMVLSDFLSNLPMF